MARLLLKTPPTLTAEHRVFSCEPIREFSTQQLAFIELKCAMQTAGGKNGRWWSIWLFCRYCEWYSVLCSLTVRTALWQLLSLGLGGIIWKNTILSPPPSPFLTIFFEIIILSFPLPQSSHIFSLAVFQNPGHFFFSCHYYIYINTYIFPNI